MVPQFPRKKVIACKEDARESGSSNSDPASKTSLTDVRRVLALSRPRKQDSGCVVSDIIQGI